MRRCYECMKEYDEKLEACPYCGCVEFTTPEIKNTDTPETKRSGGPGAAKAIIAAVVAIAVIIGIAAVVKFVPKKQADEAETTVITEQVAAKAPKEVVDKAVEAYEEELSISEDYFSAYVSDINKDGIPEIICRPGEMGAQFALTYTEKNGLSKIDLMGHSSMTPEVYISEDNCIYMRDDGHNQGTAFYHYAAAYKIDETGFVKIGEVEGDDPENFDWEDEAVFNKMVEKYEAMFEEKLRKLIGGKEFKVYSEVANSDSPVEYMNGEIYVYSDKEISAKIAVVTDDGDYRYEIVKETVDAEELKRKTRPVLDAIWDIGISVDMESVVETVLNGEDALLDGNETYIVVSEDGVSIRTDAGSAY